MTEKFTPRSPEGAALVTLIIEIAQTFFRLRAAGKRIGAVTPWGGGLWGFLRSLDVGGPQTVPQIARARPVARQRIQRLANEAAASGYVEFVDNPAHKRSKLVRLTPHGKAAVDDLTEHFADLGEALSQDMNLADLQTAAHTLQGLREKLLSGRDRGQKADFL